MVLAWGVFLAVNRATAELVAWVGDRPSRYNSDPMKYGAVKYLQVNEYRCPCGCELFLIANAAFNQTMIVELTHGLEDHLHRDDATPAADSDVIVDVVASLILPVTGLHFLPRFKVRCCWDTRHG